MTGTPLPVPVLNRLFWHNDAGDLLTFQNDAGEDLWFTTYNVPWPGPDTYDYIALIERYVPGRVVQREDIEALSLAYELADYQPLTEAEIYALVGPSPDYPTSLPRFPDGYGGMPSPDGWSILSDGKVVRP